MNRQTNTDKLFVVINYICMLFALIIVLYPLIYVLSASISDPRLVNSGKMWLLPKGITFEGYQKVFENTDIWTGYGNTIFYTVIGTLISLAVTLPCAYALAKKGLPGKRFFSGMFLFTMFFGGGLIPLFLLVKNLHMLNTRWAILLPGAASIWNIVITKTYLQTTIPDSLEEAAEIDGCSPFMKFFKIILPLSAPIIAVMALFYGVGRWNSYFAEMIFLKDKNKFPLQVFLREILVINQMSTTGVVSSTELKTMAEQARIADIVKYAVMIVSTLPIICIYPFLQRYFVQGVMIGSIKG